MSKIKGERNGCGYNSSNRSICCSSYLRGCGNYRNFLFYQQIDMIDLNDQMKFEQDQQEQENESGIDMHDCYHACHPLERIVLPDTKDYQEGE